MSYQSPNKNDRSVLSPSLHCVHQQAISISLKLPACGESTHLLWQLKFYATFISSADSNVAPSPKVDVHSISNPCNKDLCNCMWDSTNQLVS